MLAYIDLFTFSKLCVFPYLSKGESIQQLQSSMIEL